MTSYLNVGGLFVPASSSQPRERVTYESSDDEAKRLADEARKKKLDAKDYYLNQARRASENARFRGTSQEAMNELHGLNRRQLFGAARRSFEQKYERDLLAELNRRDHLEQARRASENARFRGTSQEAMIELHSTGYDRNLSEYYRQLEAATQPQPATKQTYVKPETTITPAPQPQPQSAQSGKTLAQLRQELAGLEGEELERVLNEKVEAYKESLRKMEKFDANGNKVPMHTSESIEEQAARYRQGLISQRNVGINKANGHAGMPKPQTSKAGKGLLDKAGKWIKGNKTKAGLIAAVVVGLGAFALSKCNGSNKNEEAVDNNKLTAPATPTESPAPTTENKPAPVEEKPVESKDDGVSSVAPAEEKSADDATTPVLVAPIATDETEKTEEAKEDEKVDEAEKTDEAKPVATEEDKTDETDKTEDVKPGDTIMTKDGKVYIVKDGDCLWNIAKQFLIDENKDAPGYEPSGAEIRKKTLELMEINNKKFKENTVPEDYYVDIFTGEKIKLEKAA